VALVLPAQDLYIIVMHLSWKGFGLGLGRGVGWQRLINMTMTFLLHSFRANRSISLVEI